MVEHGRLEDVDMDRVPRHIGIIMDGNGRWANAQNLPRIAGHARGEVALFDAIQGALDLGVEWLTVYAFSTENWSRDADEVSFLMHFNADILERRRDELHGQGVAIHFMGDMADARIPQDLKDRIRISEELTAANTTMHLVFAFNYGGRLEVSQAARQLASRVQAGELSVFDIDEAAIADAMYLPKMPDPELIIRSSGEQRTSNFLMWQAVYSEYVFTPVLWPDFDRYTLFDCVVEYQGRERRLGGAQDAAVVREGSMAIDDQI